MRTEEVIIFLFVGLAIVLLIALISFIAYYFWKKNDDKKKKVNRKTKTFEQQKNELIDKQIDTKYVDENENKYWVEPVWNEELFNNVCFEEFGFISKEYLQNFFSEEELAQRKYETRPFVCLKKFKHNNKKYGMYVPLRTNHKANGITYPTNIYICDDKKLIDLLGTIFAPISEVNNNGNWQPDTNVKDEINKRHNSISYVYKDIYWKICCYRKYGIDNKTIVNSFEYCFVND